MNSRASVINKAKTMESQLNRLLLRSVHHRSKQLAYDYSGASQHLEFSPHQSSVCASSIVKLESKLTQLKQTNAEHFIRLGEDTDIDPADISANDIASIGLEWTFVSLLNESIANADSGNFSSALDITDRIINLHSLPQSSRFYANKGYLLWQNNVGTELDTTTAAEITKYFTMAIDTFPEGEGYSKYRDRLSEAKGDFFANFNMLEEAKASYESLSSSSLKIRPMFKLGVCYLLTREAEKLRGIFKRMISSYTCLYDKDLRVGNSNLSDYINRRKNNDTKLLLTTAICLAPVLAGQMSRSRSTVKSPQHHQLIDKMIKTCSDTDLVSILNGYKVVIDLCQPVPAIRVQTELELVNYLFRYGNIQMAKDLLLSMEHRGDEYALNMASCNLSWLYFTQRNIPKADELASRSLRFNRYNSSAIVNKANCFFVASGGSDSSKHNLCRARDLYLEAICLNATNVEAMFNLSIVHYFLEDYEKAAKCLQKLSKIYKGPEVRYLLGEVSFHLDPDMVRSEFGRLCNAYTDPSAFISLFRYVNSHNPSGFKPGFEYLSEALSIDPSNVEAASFAANIAIDNNDFKRAHSLFLMAYRADGNVDWKVRSAHCLKRLGDLAGAYAIYEEVHSEFPRNIEAIDQLIELGKNEFNLNTEELEKKRSSLSSKPKNETSKSLLRRGTFVGFTEEISDRENGLKLQNRVRQQINSYEDLEVESMEGVIDSLSNVKLPKQM